MKKIIAIIIMTGVCSVSHSQDIVKWNFSAKKISDNTYEIHLTPAVQNLWHIYSQTSPEGGALPTKISFNKNPLVAMEGKTKEVGKIVSKYEEVFDVRVKYFEGKADFVQVVRLKASVKTNISGNIEFMACNDEQCLPPKTAQFSIPIQ
jgi:thiol:disulfide interchange protein DsbD